ncbi:MAG TPA: VOC family protein [Terriglobales bacterium]
MPHLPSKFSFDAVYYRVKDMETSIPFYRNVLGFPLQSRDYVACFKLNGVLFELVPPAHGQAISSPGNARLSLGVSNIEHAIRYLSASGVQPTQ